MFSRGNPNERDEIDVLPDLEIEYSNISVLREEMIKGYFIIYISYKNSAIPYMLSLLNSYEGQKSDILKSISVPMNYGAPTSISL